MREILYRAISLCRGEGWVYGQPRHYARNPHTEKWTIYDPYTGIETDIAEETLGQYTGVTDKNGNKIFEGDIVDCWSQGRHCTNGIVTWMENRIFITIKGKDGHVVDNWHIMPNNNGIDEGLSVIGNIFDSNLKVEKDEQGKEN